MDPHIINLLSPEDEMLRRRIANKTEYLAKCAIRTLDGINIKIPTHLRDPKSTDCLRCLCNGENGLNKEDEKEFERYKQRRVYVEARKEQTHIHVEPHKHHSLSTFYNILDDLHKLNLLAFHIHDKPVRAEIQTDIHDLTIMVLRLLHMS